MRTSPKIITDHRSKHSSFEIPSTKLSLKVFIVVLSLCGMYWNCCGLKTRPTSRTRLFSTLWQPTCFGATFQMPERPGPFILEQRNLHPLDKYLSFDEKRHKYSYDNVPLRCSVTEVVTSYFKKFEADAAIEIMMTGGNWPRPQYCDENGIPLTPEVIKKKWYDIGELARNQGTWMHANIEDYFNSREVAGMIPEFSQFLQFNEEVVKAKEIQPFRTEWRIAAPDLQLGGSVDFVGKKKDGSYVLMDWKRSKNLPVDFHRSFGKFGRDPISHLPDCSGSKYSLQLNMYRHILKKYYDVHVSEMHLASFHPELDKYFVAQVDVMDAEISAIVEDIAVLHKLP